MTCPDDGTLRAWIDDEPSGGGPGGGPYADKVILDEHLAGCDSCQQRTAGLHRTAGLAAPALALLAPSRLPTATEVEAARVRLVEPQLTDPQRSGATVSRAATDASRRRSVRLRWSTRPLAGAAALVLGVAVLASPAGRSAAADFLAQFRSEQLAVVAIDEQDVAALEELRQLGTVSGDQAAFEAEPVSSPRAAARQAGFAVVTPDLALLPPGVRRTPRVQVSRPSEVRFTFDRDRAQRWFQAQGEQPVLPERFDGSSLVISVPAAVTLQYPAADGTPGLVVGQARPVEASTEGGVTLEEMRAFLLDLPGLSESTRSQLESIGDWRSTLPLPVPADEVAWESTTIDGGEAFLLSDGSGLLNAAVWQRDGFIYGVGGQADIEVVRDVAASLR